MTQKTARYITNLIETKLWENNSYFKKLWSELPTSNDKFHAPAGAITKCGSPDYRRAILSDKLESLSQVQAQQIINLIEKEQYKKVITLFKTFLII